MTDVRAALEIEARKRARYDRIIKRFVKAMVWINVVAAVILFARHASFGETFFRLLPALAFIGAAAGYSPAHRKALGAALADPDPALDAYFIGTLTSPDPAILGLGREAIAHRFHDCLPEIGPAEWRIIALNLARSRGKDAARIVDLLHRGGTASTIDATEAFAASTRDDRLRTATHQALAEIRLRAAREMVLEAVETANRTQTEERERLRR